MEGEKGSKRIGLVRAKEEFLVVEFLSEEFLNQKVNYEQKMVSCFKYQIIICNMG